MPSLYDLNALALAAFRTNLSGVAGSSARQYLKHRGITEGQIEKFGIGLALYGPHPISDILTSHGVTGDDAVATGLCHLQADGSLIDKFRNRIIFPIHDTEDRLIAFGGRALKEEQAPKYLNSPETAVFSKREHLYNLNRAKQHIEDSGDAIVVEGYMDVIGLDRAGIYNVVAVCGTALGPQHASLLLESANTVFLCFDSDIAGMKATHRALFELVGAGLDVRVVRIPKSCKDPDEYARKHGADGYYRLLEQAQTFLAWGIEAGRHLFDNFTPEGREAMLAWVLPLVRLAGGDAAAQLADALGVDRWQIARCVQAERRGDRQAYTRSDAIHAISISRNLSS
jgi:DNA primase